MDTWIHLTVLDSPSHAVIPSSMIFLAAMVERRMPRSEVVEVENVGPASHIRSETHFLEAAVVTLRVRGTHRMF